VTKVQESVEPLRLELRLEWLNDSANQHWAMFMSREQAAGGRRPAFLTCCCCMRWAAMRWRHITMLRAGVHACCLEVGCFIWPSGPSSHGSAAAELVNTCYRPEAR
jgi:hypothetical protein